MRRRQADRNQQVRALALPRNNRPVRDRVRGKAPHLHIPLVVDPPVPCIPLHIVRVHRIRRHPHGIGHHLGSLAVFLCHHQVGHHPSGLANVQLLRPAAIVGEFIPAQTPRSNLSPDLFGHSPIIRQEVHQPLLVPGVRPHNLLPPTMIRPRIVTVAPDEVGGKCPAVVAVRLAIRHWNVRTERIPHSRLDVSQQQFVLARVVSLGSRKRNPVLRVIGQAHPKVVGLNPRVPLSLPSRCARVDSRQQAARGIAGDHIRINRNLELMLGRVRCLDAVECLAVDRIRLAPHMVTHARSGQQVPFVARVDEDLPGDLPSRFKPDPQ